MKTPNALNGLRNDVHIEETKNNTNGPLHRACLRLVTESNPLSQEVNNIPRADVSISFKIGDVYTRPSQDHAIIRITTVALRS